MVVSLQTILNKTETSILLKNISYHLPIVGNISYQLKTSEGLISNEAVVVIKWINHTVICQAIALFGIVTNIINIICFTKQGFKDPVNVSLFGLTISDLGCLATLMWLNITFTPAFEEADLPFIALDVGYLTGGWPHVGFTRITSWITALITLERCLCISVPLKVKAIITPKRVFIIICCVFAVLIISFTPVYCVNALAMKFYPDRNKTILGLVFTENRASVEKLSFAVNNVFIPMSAFVTVLVCTITLVVKLQRKTKWRKQSSFSGNSNAISNRDQKIAKMVVMISTLFIVCFIPACIIFAAMAIEPEIAVDRRFKNTFLSLFSVSFILETTNSSVNVLIYYRMSSRYRIVFRQLFWLSDEEAKAIVVESSKKVIQDKVCETAF